MSQKKAEANYVACDMCGIAVPQSCIIFEKGGTFPELAREEHKKHGVEICSTCFTRMKKDPKRPAAA